MRRHGAFLDPYTGSEGVVGWERVEVWVLLDRGADRRTVLGGHPIEMAPEQPDAGRVPGEDRLPGVLTAADATRQLPHVVAEFPSQRRVLQCLALLVGGLVPAPKPGQVLPGLRDGPAKLGLGRRYLILEVGEVACHPGTAAAEGAGGNASALKVEMQSWMKDFTMFRKFQKTMITLRALLIMVMASLTLLISFHCP